ncbi:hypothetical protein GCM10022600_18750 [Qipengyuania pelagi]|uniref:Uncharacterized protein n=1 Tax=Qipengyuania pelagi TaxID=994320 RepID=A0A844Y7L3_9SPHN|nr:hypothetical protein [Qipengyuania pelagi]MXO53273.1 hypothetical protein [Qipengyuania pelagi]
MNDYSFTERSLRTHLLEILQNLVNESGEPTWVNLSQLNFLFGQELAKREGDTGYASSNDLVADIEATVENLVSDGLVDTYEAKSIAKTPFRLSSQGQYELSGFSQLVLEGLDQTHDRHDAEAWTGPRYVWSDARKLRELRAYVQDLHLKVQTINFRTEADRIDIQRLVEALVALCQMVEPDLNLLEKLTAHPKFKAYASVAVCIATIRGALGF